MLILRWFGFIVVYCFWGNFVIFCTFEVLSLAFGGFAFCGFGVNGFWWFWCFCVFCGILFRNFVMVGGCGGFVVVVVIRYILVCFVACGFGGLLYFSVYLFLWFTVVVLFWCLTRLLLLLVCVCLRFVIFVFWVGARRKFAFFVLCLGYSGNLLCCCVVCWFLFLIVSTLCFIDLLLIYACLLIVVF